MSQYLTVWLEREECKTVTEREECKSLVEEAKKKPKKIPWETGYIK